MSVVVIGILEVTFRRFIRQTSESSWSLALTNAVLMSLLRSLMSLTPSPALTSLMQVSFKPRYGGGELALNSDGITELITRWKTGLSGNVLRTWITKWIQKRAEYTVWGCDHLMAE